MSQQDSLRDTIQKLAALESGVIGEDVPEEKDTLAEELAAEYRAFLSELGPVTSSSSQAKPATAPIASSATATTGNTAASTTSKTAVSTTASTAAQDAAAQKELANTIAQLKPAIGTAVDPTKTAQELAAAGQQSPSAVTKAFGPALSNLLKDPAKVAQLKNLLK